MNNSPKIAISTSSFAETNPRPLEILRNAGCQVTLNPFKRTLSEDELISLLNGTHGLIAGLETLNDRVFSKSPALRVISRVGVGISNIDFDSARKNNIHVFSTPEAPTEAVAEFTLGAMLSLTRQLPYFNSLLKSHVWKKSFSHGLSQVPVLLIGYGRIGRSVAQKLKAFNATVLVHDPLIQKSDDPSVTHVSLEEGLAQAHIISLHASGEEQILGPNEFKLIKKSPILINPSRGKLIHEPSLLHSLNTNVISSAWIDVFHEEPYSGPLLHIPNCFVSPHISGYTPQARYNMEIQAVENLLQALKLNVKL